MAAERNNKRIEHEFEATQHKSKKVKGSEEEAVHSRRIRVLKDADEEAECSSGGVVYWVFRDQRCRDNWALIHAAEQARKKGVSFAVVFCLLEQFLGAGARQFGFMLRGMRVMEKNLRKLGIPFFLLQGNPEDILPAFLEKSRASVLVMDFSPLRIVRSWHERIVAELHQTPIAIHQVDAHNVVPVWFASERLEYGARTIRTKIQKKLPEFLVDYPELGSPVKPWITSPPAIDWDALIAQVLRRCAEVAEVDWIEPGEDAAMEALVGKNGFLTSRIANYSDDRNDPSKPGCISNLSPYLHYGQISAQRCAFEARKVRRIHTRSVDGFLEELIIRRELAENFCYYQPQYDKIQGAWDWAQKTLRDHAADKREHLYTKEQLEKANTDDELWNASQLEMVHRGKMHGFMRMYWAKKILEWTKTPEEALAIAIYLNDKYELDGRDPNGYVGCMWSICGVHDQGWKERPIFGKIRYMNYAGCRRKFNVEKYIAYVNKIVLETQRQNCQPSSKSSDANRAA